MNAADDPREILSPEDYERVDRATRRLLDMSLDECSREDLYSLNLMQRAEIKMLHCETVALQARIDQGEARLTEVVSIGTAEAEAYANGEVDR